MTRIVPAALAASALLACSDDGSRRPAGDQDAPVEVARVDSGLISIEDTAGARVTVQEEEAPPPRSGDRETPAPAPAPRPAVPAPEPEPEPASPEPEAETERPAVDEPVPPEPDTAHSAAVEHADTQPDAIRPSPPAPVPPPARAPDTVGTSRPVPARSPAVTVPSTDPPRPDAAITIPAGTELHAALVDSIHSRHDSAGRVVTAKVMQNVTGPDGRTVIPAGAVVRLTVVRLEPAKSRSAADGELELRVDAITRGEDTLLVAADVRPVAHELRGRGVTGSEAAKVGAGAAAGAIAGRVLGGDTKGAVVGGVVGAAGGAAVAAQTADRDVVVKAGTPISFVLTTPVAAGRL